MHPHLPGVRAFQGLGLPALVALDAKSQQGYILLVRWDLVAKVQTGCEWRQKSATEEAEPFP